MKTCILISTCDKYALLAAHTIRLLDERWDDHPTVFVCGVSSKLDSSTNTLLLKNDSKDWIGILESATKHLLEKGYQKCYLILDDHPPLAICNATHLNKTLPDLMDRLGAAYIGLFGWDQGTTSQGEILSMKYYRLQRQSDSFIWRFSLHPALWDLVSLCGIVSTLSAIPDDPASRSVWAFERRSGAGEYNEKLARWWGRSYRIYGAGMLAGKFILIRAMARGLYFYFSDLILWLIGKIAGGSVRERMSNLILPGRLFFDGPYPLYWSGVLQKGRLNKNFEKYLLRRKRTDELDDFRRVIESFPP